jgi:hypothetical protein
MAARRYWISWKPPRRSSHNWLACAAKGIRTLARAIAVATKLPDTALDRPAPRVEPALSGQLSKHRASYAGDTDHLNGAHCWPGTPARLGRRLSPTRLTLAALTALVLASALPTPLAVLVWGGPRRQADPH